MTTPCGIEPQMRSPKPRKRGEKKGHSTRSYRAGEKYKAPGEAREREKMSRSAVPTEEPPESSDTEETRARRTFAVATEASQRFNPYEILEIPSDANAAQVKRAYRAMCLRFHPDTALSDETGNHRFHQIQEAYRVLRNARSRAEWEESRAAWERELHSAKETAAMSSDRPAVLLSEAWRGRIANWGAFGSPRLEPREGSRLAAVMALALTLTVALGFTVAALLMSRETGRRVLYRTAADPPLARSEADGTGEPGARAERTRSQDGGLLPAIRSENGLPHRSGEHPHQGARGYSGDADFPASEEPAFPGEAIRAPAAELGGTGIAALPGTAQPIPLEIGDVGEGRGPQQTDGQAGALTHGRWMASCSTASGDDVFLGWLDVNDRSSFYWRSAATQAAGTDRDLVIEAALDRKNQWLLDRAGDPASRPAAVIEAKPDGSRELHWLRTLGRPADGCADWTLFPANRGPSPEGLWLLPQNSDIRSGSFAPEYVELTLKRRDGLLSGRFTGRYRVPSVSMGSAVQLQLRAVPELPGWFRWNDPAGGEGVLAVAAVDRTRLATFWKRTTLIAGKPQLSSGFAVLLRMD